MNRFRWLLMVSCLVALLAMTVTSIPMQPPPTEGVQAPVPSPEPTLQPAESDILWEAETADLLVTEAEFAALVRGTAVDGTLSNEALYYVTYAAFSLPGEYDVSDARQAIVREIAARLDAAPPEDDAQWLYLYQAGMTVYLRTLPKAEEDAQAMPLELARLAEMGQGILAMYPRIALTADPAHIAAAASLAQAYVYMDSWLTAWGMTGWVPQETALQCRIFADDGAQRVLDAAYLALGMPLWFDQEASLRLSQQAIILQSLHAYKSKGGSVPLPYTYIQCEGTLSAFSIQEAREGEPNQYYAHAYWLYRPADASRDAAPDGAALAWMSVASKQAGRGTLGVNGVIALLRSQPMTEPSTLYALAAYLFE